MKPLSVILHSSEVRAILAGKQTQLRLPAWALDKGIARKPSRYAALASGDLLWVQEPYVEFVGWRKGQGKYGIGYGHIGHGALAPAHMRDVEKKVHPRQADRMPRAHSRLTLEVTQVWREALRNIGAASILACGFQPAVRNGHLGCAPVFDVTPSCWAREAFDAYVKFWDHRFGRDAWRCDSTDSMVAVAFTAHPQNIDALLNAHEAEGGALAEASEALGGPRMGGQL